MRKENQAEKDVLNGLSRIIDKVPTELRQEAFKGLARIYVNIVDEETKSWIEEICIHHCHLCGEICRTDVDEVNDESYIVCSGGSHMALPNGRKLRVGHEEEDIKNIYYTPENDCKNKGRESEGIGYFVEMIK